MLVNLEFICYNIKRLLYNGRFIIKVSGVKNAAKT